ncbi:MAG TPA: hypothetical protein VKT70_08050 [Stellaceae bacterium]|nr:hypothetical protein [Stellaceae bacterium]
MKSLARQLSPHFHYAWIVAAVTFLMLLSAAGIRSTPSVLIVPLEQSFGWERGTISLAMGINITLYGLIGPFAVALMQQIGIRRTVLSALALLSLSVAASSFMMAPWQLILSCSKLGSESKLGSDRTAANPAIDFAGNGCEDG